MFCSRPRRELTKCGSAVVHRTFQNVLWKEAKLFSTSSSVPTHTSAQPPNLHHPPRRTPAFYNCSKFKPIISQTTVTVLFLASSLWAVSDCPPLSVCCWAPWWLSPGPSLGRLFSSLFPSAASVVSVSPSAVAPGPYTPPHPGNDGGSQTRPWFLVPRHQNCSERRNRNRGVDMTTYSFMSC